MNHYYLQSSGKTNRKKMSKYVQQQQKHKTQCEHVMELSNLVQRQDQGRLPVGKDS